MNTNPEARLLDLKHLAQQTMDDNALQSEVLELFHQQLLSMRDTLLPMNPEERLDLGHRLIGSARAVGAFSLADVAEALIKTPLSPVVVEDTLQQINALILHLQALAERQNIAKG